MRDLSSNNHRQLKRALNKNPAKAQELMDAVLLSPQDYINSKECIEVLMDFGASLTEEQYNAIPEDTTVKDTTVKGLLAYATNFRIPEERKIETVAEYIATKLQIADQGKEGAIYIINRCLFINFLHTNSDSSIPNFLNKPPNEPYVDPTFLRHFRFPYRTNENEIKYAPLAHCFYYAHDTYTGRVVNNRRNLDLIIDPLGKYIKDINIRDGDGNTVTMLFSQKAETDRNPSQIMRECFWFFGSWGKNCDLYALNNAGESPYTTLHDKLNLNTLKTNVYCETFIKFVLLNPKFLALTALLILLTRSGIHHFLGSNTPIISNALEINIEVSSLIHVER